jgi:hypothetical protein
MLGLLVVGLLYPAGALASWNAPTQPLPPPGSNNAKVSLTSVSCPSPGDCSAVGSYVDTTGVTEGVLLSEENGSWASGVEARLPSDAETGPDQKVSLNSISCPSAGNCTAVGTYVDKNTGATRGLLLSEVDRTWGAGTEPTLPSDAGSGGVQISDVSCSSAGNCSAVGTYPTSTVWQTVLLLNEVNGYWMPGIEGELPAEASAVETMNGVSCPSDGDCTAVGLDAESGGEGTVLLSEVNGAWEAGTQATAPTGDEGLFPSTVSCSSPGNCVVGGTYWPNREPEGMLLTETNDVWGEASAIQPPANAASDPGFGIDGVSCPANGYCSLVGDYQDSSYQHELAVMTESDGVWGPTSEVPLPDDAGPHEGWIGASISCWSIGDCAASGDYADSAGSGTGFLLTQDGGRWSGETDWTLPGNAYSDAFATLNGISCAQGDCAAVGSYSDVAGDTDGVILRLSNGSQDAPTQAALPGGAGAEGAMFMTSVSCPEPGSCDAVGEYNGDQPLLLSERGGTWETGTTTSLPANAESISATLTSISCSSTGNCSAVGNYNDKSENQQALLLTESDGNWGPGIEATLPANADSTQTATLSSISCTATGDCSAVGTYDSGGESQGFMITETNGNWGRGVEAQSPEIGEPYQVSCASPGNCAAIGGGLLLNQTDGTWSSGSQAVPPSNADQTPELDLNDVSCASVGNCTAVGSYQDQSLYQQPLIVAETGGVWEDGIEGAVPADAGGQPPDGGQAESRTLNAVSCPSADACSAVGEYTDQSQHFQGFMLSQGAGDWQSASEAALPSDALSNPDVMLTSVSCAAPGQCSAAGDYDASGTQSGLLLDSQSGSWTPGTEVIFGSGPDRFLQLSSVSCGGVGTCSAVGSMHDFGSYVGVLVTSSPSSTPPPALEPPSLVTLPRLGGAPSVGNAVFGTTGVWSGTQPITYSDQWQRCAPTCSDIPGATGRSYTIAPADVGAVIRLVVTARNSIGFASAGSNGLGPVLSRAPRQPGGPGSTGGSSSIRRQIRAALARLIRSCREISRKALAVRGGHWASFDAPEGGHLRLDWRVIPGHRDSTRQTTQVVARAADVIRRAHRVRIWIKLTRFGRRLIRAGNRLQLIVTASFVSAGLPTIQVQGAFLFRARLTR